MCAFEARESYPDFILFSMDLLLASVSSPVHLGLECIILCPSISYLLFFYKNNLSQNLTIEPFTFPSQMSNISNQDK